MADNIISLSDFEIIFADVIEDILGLTQDKVRISYSEDGQPFTKINENVCYLKASEEQDDINIYKQRKRKYDSETEQLTISQSSMRVLSLRVVFYGPACDVLAAKLKDYFYFESSDEFLYKNNLSLIPDKTRITSKIYEEINSRFWERVDLMMYFYNSITLTQGIGTIKSANVIIKTDMEVD